MLLMVLKINHFVAEVQQEDFGFFVLAAFKKEQK